MKSEKPENYRFLDEAGDATFYGRGRKPIVGEMGASKSFILGMVKLRTNLENVRQKIYELQNQVATDPYFKSIPSIQKKVSSGGFYFHATDDIPEVRKIFFDFISTLDLSFEAVVARKIIDIFVKKHNRKEDEFYADLLSHLLKNKFEKNESLVLTIASRGTSTRNHNLENALSKAKTSFINKKPDGEIKREIKFNIQNQKTEPLLNISDYFCWAIQRVFEKGETRYYDFLREKISLVIDLYDSNKKESWSNYYKKSNPLTSENCISASEHLRTWPPIPKFKSLIIKNENI
ncbi:hypothetical protein EHQ46_07580 [Leptospira yanagawae]|uniref:DUF3800 domain-containing protein n=1 Tax=Leptospira yanagawae TaxID=293069 RepID=A0ABY2M254_9LEPT|nr:DUF3800 domain-containing protein [Leptospira yanagawae]TGL21707.1 hypothetical protein EHQ46_07580 [Leptospira yanagawae]